MSLLSCTSRDIDIIFTVHTRQENLLQTVNEGPVGDGGTVCWEHQKLLIIQILAI